MYENEKNGQTKTQATQAKLWSLFKKKKLKIYI